MVEMLEVCYENVVLRKVCESIWVFVIIVIWMDIEWKIVCMWGELNEYVINVGCKVIW